MEKVYTFTKSALIKKVTIISSIIFIAVGILSFFQDSLSYPVYLQVGNHYFFESDTYAAVFIFLSSVICIFVALKMQKILYWVLRILGIMWMVFGIMGITHGTTYGYNDLMFGLFSIDGVAGWLYLVVGAIITAFSFFCKNKSQSR